MRGLRLSRGQVQNEGVNFGGLPLYAQLKLILECKLFDFNKMIGISNIPSDSMVSFSMVAKHVRRS